MSAKRIGLGVAVMALGVGISGAVTNSSGQSSQPQAVGLSYGGTKSGDTAWLRLDATRQLVMAFEATLEIAPERCENDRNGYYSIIYGGFHYGSPLVINEGKFRGNVNDRYRDDGILYQERVTVAGTITGRRASGTISGQVIATKRNGSVARCNSRVQTWSVTD